MRILIVDDEAIALASLKRLLKWRGLRDVAVCDNGSEAIRRINAEDFDLVLLDLLMPEVDGLQVLEAAKPFKPLTEFIILTAMDDVETAVKAVRLGAYDYLIKPVENERLILSIERAFERKGLISGFTGADTCKRETQVPPAFSHIVCRSPRMIQLLAYADIMARSGNPVLITGESGTGKELLARGIHRAGPKPEGPFVAVNVASIPESLCESFFFGHVKGAFTGADRDYKGYFEQASGGTLFLDEIGELPLQQQAKLLRAVEEKKVTPVGGNKSVEVDIRIVSATNVDIDKACQERKFRLDLLYRLKSAHIRLPSLRERQEDIPLLAGHFLQKASERHGKNVRGISPEAMEVLTHKDYPGNIRELAQVVEHGVLLADSPLILPHHMGETVSDSNSFTRSLCSLKENDEAHFVYVLTHCRGNSKETARILGISVRQVQRKIVEMRGNARWKPVLENLVNGSVR